MYSTCFVQDIHCTHILVEAGVPKDIKFRQSKWINNDLDLGFDPTLKPFQFFALA